MTAPEQASEQEVPEVETALTAENALAGLFDADIQVSDDSINVTSNSGSTVQIPATAPMSVADVMQQSGISPGKDTQVIVDGVPVADDHMIAPGTEIYLHRVVQGG